MFVVANIVLLSILCSSGRGGSGSGGRPAVIFMHANCDGYTALDRDLEEAAAGAACEDVRACYDTAFDLTAIAAPSDATLVSELDVLLEELHAALNNPAVQYIGVVYQGCSSWLGVLADVLSTSVYNIPLLSFGWKRAAVITENTPAFIELSEALQNGLDAEAIAVHHHQWLDSTHILPDTATLFTEDVKIFVLNTSPSLTRAVLCQALHTLNLPGYVWITHGWFEEGWWLDGEREDKSEFACTGQQLARYLEGSLAVSHHPRHKENDGRDLRSGDKSSCFKSPSELATELLLDQQTLMQSSFNSVSTSPSVPDSAYLVYDAVWTAADAWRAATHFANFTSNYPNIIDTVEFQGTSGPVSFSNGCRKATNLTLEQYRFVNGHLEKVLVADLVPSNTTEGTIYDVIYSGGEGPATLWENGVPLDGTPIEVEHYPYPAVMGFIYTYSSLGVLFAFACLIFNFVFRKKKLIKLTSPNLNNMIVVGAIISYLSGLTFFYPEGASRAGIIWGCNLRAWSVSLGYTLCYSTLNVKMWRVYAIVRKPLRKPSLSKAFFKDLHLMLLVLGFTMVDAIILTVVMCLENSRYTITIIPNKQDPSPHINDDGIKEVSVVSRCLSRTEPFWLSAIYGYKAVVQALGLYFAFKIRNVKIRGLNDSREVSIALYVTTVVIVAMIVVTFVFGDYIDVDGFVYGFGVSTAVTFVLCLTFIPKMVSLYRDPDGKNIFQNTTIVEAHISDLSELVLLRKRIKELEKQVMSARSQENLTDASAPLSQHPSQDASQLQPPSLPSSTPSDTVHITISRTETLAE